jgi:hypothetical protein
LHGPAVTDILVSRSHDGVFRIQSLCDFHFTGKPLTGGNLDQDALAIEQPVDKLLLAATTNTECSKSRLKHIRFSALLVTGFEYTF